MRTGRRRPRLAPDDPRLRWVLPLGCGIGVLLVVIAVVLSGVQLSRADWPSVDGVVVQVSTTTKRNGSSRVTTYQPTVSYDVDGRHYVAQSHSRSSTRVAVGDRWPVRYDPADPAHASLNSLFFSAAIVGGIGAMFLLLFGILWRQYRRGGPTSWHVTVPTGH